MDGSVINIEGAGKKFSKSLRDSMLYGIGDILQGAFRGQGPASALRRGEFWAVEDISFELKKGETLGIIGPNGSGKTTLLRMLTGIFMPDKGRITVQGRVGGLIHVGAGFHPLLSGKENIYINGAILGMSKSEIDRKFDSIVAFADIGDFLDAPVKHYSSGMFVRLGFAVAIHSRPDILLIDEILSVGDIKFQSKCAKFMTDHLLKEGCTVVFVSHNRYAVQDLCRRALYLNRGRMVGIGDTAEIMDRYLEDMQEPQDLSLSSGRPGERNRITKIEFLDEQGALKEKFQSGESVRIRVHYALADKVDRPSVGLTFVHADNRYSVVSSTDYLLNVHSGYDGFQVPSLQGEGYFEVAIDHFYLPIGVYKYMTYLFTQNNLNLIHKNESAGQIEIAWTQHSSKRSLMDLPRRWDMKIHNGRT